MLLLNTVSLLFQVYFWMLLCRILLSWFPDWQSHPIAQFIIYYTDPYLNVFRRIIPPLGMIDISPIFAFIALQFLEGLVLKLIIAFL